MQADVIIANATVHTMLPGDLHSEPRSIAIASGRILAVGEPIAIHEAFKGSKTRVDDGSGVTVTPGLIDGHIHPGLGSEYCQGLDLSGITSMSRLREILATESRRVLAAENEEWVRGWNLDYTAFEGQPPRAEHIDEATQGLPVLLFLFDGHTALASSEALRRANIHGPRQFDDSSEIVVDASGRPTGELQEDSAFKLVYFASPQPSAEEEARNIQEVLSRMRRSGLTGGTIMDGTPETLDLLERIGEVGSGLPVRLVSALDIRPTHTASQRARIKENRDRSGKRWRTGFIKLYADGVVDTGRAWLYEPDVDGSGTRGFWGDQSAFVETVREFTAAGFQVATHAIGDRAVGETISAYEAVGCRAEGRAVHRIEHLETLAQSDIERLARTGITASMQPLHMQWRIPDGSDEWSRRLGPDRAAQAWNAGAVLRAGGALALGSDWPVAELDARQGIAWSMLRRRPGDHDGFVHEPRERLTAHQALHGYTRGAALAQGDNDLGVVREGALADLAIWEEDPVQLGGDEIANLPVIATYLSGERKENDG